MSTETKHHVLTASGNGSGSLTGLSFLYDTIKKEYELSVRLSDRRVWQLTSAVPLQRWYHVTVTWHEAWGLQYYLDGKCVQQAAKWARQASQNFSVATGIVVGGAESQSDEIASLGANLLLSDLRVWEKYTHKAALLDNFRATGKWREWPSAFETAN